MLVRLLYIFRIHRIFDIILDNSNQDDEDIKDFLINSAPDGYRTLYFNHTHNFRLNLSTYAHSILTTAARVENTFRIEHMSLTKDEFIKMLVTSKHCGTWNDVVDLKIDTIIHIDFRNSLDGWRIRYLNWEYTGSPTNSNWREKSSGFELIIQALSQ